MRSLLFTTSITGVFSPTSFNNSDFFALLGRLPSVTKSTISLDLAISLLRLMPMLSTTSLLSLSPAVSTKRRVIPFHSRVSSMLSRVVPAMSVTIALSRPVSALSREDFPTLVSPTIATVMPFFTTDPARQVDSSFSVLSMSASRTGMAARRASSSISSG